MQDHRVDADLFHGAIELEATARGVIPHRLPAWARAQCADPQLMMAEVQPAGVRLAFRTEATEIELDAVRTKRWYVGAPPRPDGIYDLLVDGGLAGQASVGGGNVIAIAMAKGTAVTEPGPAGTLRFGGLPARAKDIEIWLPYNEATEIVALRGNAPCAPSGRRCTASSTPSAKATRARRC